MKHCFTCKETSPVDAQFCIGCGKSFAATGATGATQRLDLPLTQEGAVYPSIPKEIFFSSFDDNQFRVRSRYGFGVMGTKAIVKITS